LSKASRSMHGRHGRAKQVVQQVRRGGSRRLRDMHGIRSSGRRRG
jgi:hypothetical protein